VAFVINELTDPINDVLAREEQVVPRKASTSMKIHCVTATYSNGSVRSLRCITRQTAEILAEGLALKEPAPVEVRIRPGNCKCAGESKRETAVDSESQATRHG
jgi:hypothetical protein